MVVAAVVLVDGGAGATPHKIVCACVCVLSVHCLLCMCVIGGTPCASCAAAAAVLIVCCLLGILDALCGVRVPKDLLFNSYMRNCLACVVCICCCKLVEVFPGLIGSVCYAWPVNYTRSAYSLWQLERPP